MKAPRSPRPQWEKTTAHATAFPSAKRQNAAFYAGLVAACAAVFWLARNHLLFAFYYEGIAYLDGGLFSGLLYHNDWRLKNPVSQDVSFGGTFFTTHISPFLIPFTYLSRLLPLTPTEFFAFFMAAAATTYAAAVYIAAFYFLADQSPRLRSIIAAIIAAPGAVILSLNGITTDIISYPHYELWMPAFMCLFLLAFAYQKRRAAAVCFILLLSVRQDAGFHLSILLLAVAAVHHYRAKRNIKAQKGVFLAQRELYYWIGGALLYSAVIFSFFGRPIQSGHDDFPLFLSRLSSILFRSDWFFPLLVLGGWAWLTRNATVFVAAASCLPWVLIHATRESWFLGHLILHYSFPLLPLFFFPFVADRFFPAAAKPAPLRKNTKTAILFFLAFSAATLPGRPTGEAVPIKYEENRSWKKTGLKRMFIHNLSPPSSVIRTRVTQLMDFFARHQQDMDILVGDAMTSLMPHATPLLRHLISDSWGDTFKQDSANILIVHQKFLIWQNLHINTARTLFNLDYVYALPETKFYLISKAPLCENQKCVHDLPLQPVMFPDSYKRDAVAKLQMNPFNFNPAALAVDTKSKKDDEVVSSGPGTVLALNDYLMPPGPLAIRLKYAHDIQDKAITPQLEIAVRKEGEDYAKKETTVLPPSANGELVEIGYLIPPRSPDGFYHLRFRLIHRGGGTLRITEVGFYPVNNNPN